MALPLTNAPPIEIERLPFEQAKELKPTIPPMQQGEILVSGDGGDDTQHDPAMQQEDGSRI